ncbi:alpha/beta hydrolase [Halorubrum kocurii]|uniref:Phospholipase/carboxylesterase n=1 Tax=Halorubrum kocurii JCM 14978 TaxID=1230456 RepID=M0P115_9EURY|nr:phospholipase/carboxylesterase [Halorubrum kocurii]EMA63513.1 phospholipase/carboxylesterase [Halorubrum kocurii JCM 14978]
MSRGSPHVNDDPHAGEPLVTAGAPIESADAAVVLVHGRGATARSIVEFGEEIAGDSDTALSPAAEPPAVKGTSSLSLLAPQAAANTWYPNSFLAPVADNEPGRSSGLRTVGRAVQTAADAGIPPERVLLGGFSQGACLASEYVARTPRRYGGLAVLSGGLIGESVAVADYVSDAADEVDGDAADALGGTPAFLGCSDADPHIPEERVHETAAVLEALGGDVDARIYEGMGHGINAEETDAVAALVAELT